MYIGVLLACMCENVRNEPVLIFWESSQHFNHWAISPRPPILICYVCLCTSWMPGTWKPEEDNLWPFGTGDTKSSLLPGGWWESNPGPLKRAASPLNQGAMAPAPKPTTADLPVLLHLTIINKFPLDLAQSYKVKRGLDDWLVKARAD